MRPPNRHPASDLSQDIWIIILAFLDAKSYVHLRAVNKTFFCMFPAVIKIAENQMERAIRTECLEIILQTTRANHILRNALSSQGGINIFTFPPVMRKPLHEAIHVFAENNPVRAKRIAKSLGVLTVPVSETTLRQLAIAVPALKNFAEDRIQQNEKYAGDTGWQQCCGILILELSVVLMCMFTSPKVDKVMVGVPCFVVGALLCIGGMYLFVAGYCARRELQRNGSEQYQLLLDREFVGTMAMVRAGRR